MNDNKYSFEIIINGENTVYKRLTVEQIEKILNFVFKEA